MDLVVTRFTWPDAPWQERTLGLRIDDEAAEYLTKRVRRPWLRPFLLKVLKHCFTGSRLQSLSALAFHVPDSGADLVGIARNDGDPCVRTLALVLLSRQPEARRELVADTVTEMLAGEQSQLARTVAVSVAAHLRLERTLPLLIAMLGDSSEPDTAIDEYLDRSVFWGPPPEPSGPDSYRFRPTMGQLAAYAIQRITGKDFGFTDCYHSRGKMAEIAQRIRAELTGER